MKSETRVLSGPYELIVVERARSTPASDNIADWTARSVGAWRAVADRPRRGHQRQAPRRSLGPEDLRPAAGGAGAAPTVPADHDRIRPDTSVGYSPLAAILPAEPISMLLGLILLGIQALRTGQQHSQSSESWCA